MTNVGYATLSVIPSLRGFRSSVTRGTSSAMSSAGVSAGRSFSGAFTKAARVGALGGLGAAFGIGSFIKDSVELEARYSKTMAQMRVATKAPADQLQRLDDLAIQLGKETVFSAVDASDAMLELAKNGIKPATIEAGALKSALTLAAAGSTDLSDAAGTMGNTLNAFRLKGKDSASVAAALAGAANASSASVGSLAEGLQQASTVAADAGFNVQETTGILAAFANAGISGSDAGTSLKSMLSRLIPTTKKAIGAMDQYGIEFVKRNGDFKSATEIAQELKEGLDGLSDSERSHTLGIIFGSDARRAATILTKEGADGLRDYIKATSDQGAAEEMAQANMEGTAGAIERLKGAWETAKLEFGKEIAPVAADFLDYLSENIDDVAPKLVEFGEWFRKDGVDNIKRFKNFVADDVVPVLQTLGEFASDAAGFVSDLAGAFDKLPKEAKIAGLTALLAGGAAVKLGGGGGGALGGAGRALGLARPIPVFVTNKGGLGGGAGGDVGGATKWGKAAGAAMALALGIQAADSLLPDPDKNRFVKPFGDFGRDVGDKLGLPDLFADDKADPRTTADRIESGREYNKTLIAAAESQEILRGKTNLTQIQIEGFKRKTDGAKTSLDKMKSSADLVSDVRMLPRVDTTDIERALALLNTLKGLAGRDDFGDRGFTGGDSAVTPLPAGNPRAGVVFDQRGSTIVAHDYDDFVVKSDKKARAAGLGGRP